MRLLVAGIVCVLLALSFPGIDSRVVKKFTNCSELFFKEKPPVIPGILEKSEPQIAGFRVICQKYKNKIRFATLYNTTGKIPVFSAYKYTGTNHFKRLQTPNVWMTELQLEPLSAADMHEPFAKQARHEDYLIKNSLNYFPGTLFPTSHAADEDTAQSAYTLTNCVPEKKGFREGMWNLVENEIKVNMDNNCRDNNNRTVAYVLTGVIPGKDTLNKRVNVPSRMWTAFCCYNNATASWVSQTYNAATNMYYNNSNIALKSLEYLQTILRDKWGKKLELFNKNCT
ncbi:endonuclease domain-containing 1 protein-like [Triplophysa rosa]|uniref:endonuclease domain-containing 1 protein-like n=1 Tax=Triplophysa rosa TaxID=992332 RepID=UPI002545C81A|nr:endonuclease domain-containing 1 protein-like [Triplophysa rosa]